MKNINKTIPDLVIIGGGITGLSAAYIAAKEGKKVTILESNSKFGGLLSTFEIGGNRLEHYYHHFFTHDKELNWLIKDLEIENRLIYKKTSMGVFKNGRIYNFNSIFDLLFFKPIALLDKIKFGFTSLFLGKIANWEKYENVSCISWFNKWAGKTTTDSLWAPLLKIKFGPYADKVPLSWMIGRLKQRINSRKNGDERLGYIDGSLQVLLDAILIKLKELGVEMVINAKVDKINFKDDEILNICTIDKIFIGEKYLFTIPGTHISKMLQNEKPIFAAQLDDVKYFGAICVILEMDHPLSSIYWLNIADDNFPFGGIIEHTNFVDIKKYNNSYIAYLSRYFDMEEDIANMNDMQVKELMINSISRIYPKFDKNWLKNVFLFRSNTAATICDFNFSKKVPFCKTQIDNMYISNMSHVYPDERSTNNSIKIAIEALNIMGIKTDYINNSNSLSCKIGF